MTNRTAGRGLTSDAGAAAAALRRALVELHDDPRLEQARRAAARTAVRLRRGAALLVRWLREIAAPGLRELAVRLYLRAAPLAAAGAARTAALARDVWRREARKPELPLYAAAVAAAVAAAWIVGHGV